MYIGRCAGGRMYECLANINIGSSPTRLLDTGHTWLTQLLIERNNWERWGIIWRGGGREGGREVGREGGSKCLGMWNSFRRCSTLITRSLWAVWWKFWRYNKNGRSTGEKYTLHYQRNTFQIIREIWRKWVECSVLLWKAGGSPFPSGKNAVKRLFPIVITGSLLCSLLLCRRNIILGYLGMGTKI